MLPVEVVGKGTSSCSRLLRCYLGLRRGLHGGRAAELAGDRSINQGVGRWHWRLSAD